MTCRRSGLAKALILAMVLTHELIAGVVLMRRPHRRTGPKLIEWKDDYNNVRGRTRPR